jgi:ATP-binding cassette subfamily C protein LapB
MLQVVSDKAAKDGGPARAADPLLAALLFVARHFGRTASAETLTAGLPLADGTLALDQVALAAERLQLETELVELAPKALEPLDLPLIALDRAGAVTILVALDRRRLGGGRATIFDPATGETKVLPARRYFRAYSGRALRIVPGSGFDRLAAGQEHDAGAHWFWGSVWRSRWLYGQAVVATAAINLFGLVVPLFLMIVYDRVIPSNALDTLWALAVGIGIAILLDQIFRALRNHFVDTAARRADVLLANRVFQAVLGRKLAYRRLASGAEANLVREYETLREFVGSLTLTALGDFPFILLFLLLTWAIAGPVALVPAVVVFVVILVMLLVRIPLLRVSRRALAETTDKNAVLVETFGGIETIKALGAEGWAAAKWERAAALSIASTAAARRWTNGAIGLVVAANGVASVATVVVGVHLVREGSLTAGAVIAAVILASRALAPLGQIAQLLLRLNQAVSAYRAIAALLAFPQERGRQARFVHKPSFEGRIDVKGVTFAYPEAKAPALDNVSLSARPGERIGIVGPIGSGKSTLFRLALALHEPERGMILFDGIDVAQIDPAVLRGQIGYVPQGGALFDGTIRDNLTIHAPQASEAALRRAAEASGAFEWIGRFPAGFDARVGERGGMLSGGQRQSLALARALLRDPPILLLDEPTSDLDARTEESFVQQLSKSAHGKTLIVVTHRTPVLRMVERLVVMEEGRVVADGPKAEVIEFLKRRRGDAAKPQPEALR